MYSGVHTGSAILPITSQMAAWDSKCKSTNICWVWILPYALWLRFASGKVGVKWENKKCNSSVPDLNKKYQ